MKNLGHAANFWLLIAALCFSLTGIAAAPVLAADQPAAEGTQAADAGHGAADAHGGDAHGDGHGEGSLSPAKLKDLLWRVVNFAVLMFILVKFGAKPIANFLGGRQTQIRNELEELEQRRDEAEKQYREFEAKLASVEKDIDSIVEKAVAQAEIEKAKIIERAEKAVDDLKRQSELTIQNEVIEARRRLKNEIAEEAAAMAETLIVKNLTPDDQVKIIENYLDKVGAVQ